jgi:DNA-directed RNA polymerase specialized sigma24 family protein
MPSRRRFLSSSSAAKRLKAFLAREPSALSLFPQEADHELGLLAARVGNGLPKDVRPELVDEVYKFLLSGNAPAFDPTRGTAKAYLWQAMRNAAKTVRASYAPPGQPTRLRNTVQGRPEGDVGVREQLDTETADDVVLSREGRDLEAAVRTMNAYVDTRSALARASPNVRAALELIHGHGRGVREAAEALGMSRFQLRRALDGFAATLAA